MIAEYGMGTELMSRRLPADDYSVSDATWRLVDEEQRHLTDLAWRRALRLIVEHRPLLDALAATLLGQEVLTRADIERIVAEERRPRDIEPPPPPGPERDQSPALPPLAPVDASTAASRPIEPLPPAPTPGERDGEPEG
jgi:hypothetical protein